MPEKKVKDPRFPAWHQRNNEAKKPKPEPKPDK